MKLLITGGCGFLGSNLSCKALRRGDSLLVLDNLSREGSTDNLNWLRGLGDFEFRRVDIRQATEVKHLVHDFQPDAIFHLAGQVAMTKSLADPRADFEVNALGTINLLEAVRSHSPHSMVVYSSTNKVYGDLAQFTYREQESRYECIECPKGFDESTPLSFHSPYGCSKGAADQYMLDYARVYGLKTTVLRHSSMYGGRQFATVDQGWIGWFCQKAWEIRSGLSDQPIKISGNGKQVRDVLHADDMVDLYFKCVQEPANVWGLAYNIGGGAENSLSLLELFRLLEQKLNTELPYEMSNARKSDQLVFIADITFAKSNFNWQPKVNVTEGINLMLRWVEDQMSSSGLAGDHKPALR